MDPNPPDSCSPVRARVDEPLLDSAHTPSQHVTHPAANPVTNRVTNPATSPVSLLPGPGTLGGWLIFLAGLGMLLAVILIPAQADLQHARDSRDQTLAREQHELDRIARYQQYLVSIENRDEPLLRSLAMSQLNMTPSDRLTLLPPNGPGDLDLFGPIEPTPVSLASHESPKSLLERLATDRTRRLWLIAASVLCLFVGLLPSTSTKP